MNPVSDLDDKGNKYNTAIAAMVYLLQDNLTEPVPLQVGLDFTVTLLLDWLPPQGKRDPSALIFNT